MILIGDAGGTSTHWRVIENDQKISQFETRGLNLMHHDPLDYFSAISESIDPYTESDQVFFYVAGYFESSQKAKSLNQAIQQHFRTDDIEISNDLIAAARSLCGHQKGWVGILGTGANVALYDGNSITSQVAPLGYLIGDEGSGADLGKNFVKLFFRQELEQDIKNDFLSRYHVTSEDFLASIYDKADPKLFLASFCSLLSDFKNNPGIYRMIYNVFATHFDVFLGGKKDDLPVHYTGSVAYHFGDILRQAAVDKGISIGQITQDPIAGLALYHTSNS